MKNYLPLMAATIMLLFSSTLLSCTNNSTPVNSNGPDDNLQTEATITIDNRGANAYLVTNIDGDGAASELNTPNAEITLGTGGRYTFINDAGASSHPLDFRSSNREKLLGQSNSSGSFDDDNEVNVTRNGDAITFTLTESLSGELFDYVCSFHPPMNGNISIGK